MNYLDWHYQEIWMKIIMLWQNLTLFPFYLFGIPHHLKAFFYPWKRQAFVPRPGFHLDDIISITIGNLFSRVIGAAVRSITIGCGLSMMLLTVSIGGAFTIIWPLIPG